jgi:hypothetical protein
MDKLGAEIAGDLAKMGNLTVTAANIKKALRTGKLLFSHILFRLRRALALLAAAFGFLLFLACQSLTCRLIFSCPDVRDAGTIIKMSFGVKYKGDNFPHVLT